MNEIDECDLQDEKYSDPKMATFCGMSIDISDDS
jgi:hypothetical protein